MGVDTEPSWSFSIFRIHTSTCSSCTWTLTVLLDGPCLATSGPSQDPHPYFPPSLLSWERNAEKDKTTSNTPSCRKCAHTHQHERRHWMNPLSLRVEGHAWGTLSHACIWVCMHKRREGEQWHAARRKHALSARATVAKSWLENKQWKKALFTKKKKKNQHW